MMNLVERRKNVKKRLRESQYVFGCWTSLGHPSISEIFARSGVDFVVVDLEHTTIELEKTFQNILACHSQGILCLARTASHDGEMIKRLLDSGVDGIIVPTVSSKAEVDQLIQQCKYPPDGKRGYGIAGAQGYGFDFDEYTQTWNETSLFIVQIETVHGVENINEILESPHVDGVMIGPYDLSGSLGIPGKLDHPLVKEATSKVIESCRKFGIACGTHFVNPELDTLGDTLAQGYSFVLLSSDVFLLWRWAEQTRKVVKYWYDSNTPIS